MVAVVAPKGQLQFPNSMRILYVQYANPGAYPPLEHSSRILADSGAQILFLGIGSHGADELRFPAHPKIEVRQWKFCQPGWRQKLHYIRFGLWSLWTALRWRPDWIYASDPLVCPFALAMSCLGRWRVLYHEHDSPAEGRGGGRGEGAEGRGQRTEDGRQGAGTSAFMRFVLWARQKVARQAELCVLPNDERAEYFKRETATSRPLACVWNCPRREEAEVLPPPKTKEQLILFYQGSIVPVRVPLAVVRALAFLPERVRFRIAGYETIGHRGYIQELQKEAKRAGVSERVEFLGTFPRSELLPRCRGAHVGLSLMPRATSDLNEQAMTGASNKAFEYLACGVALLVTDLPSWQRMFVEPRYGLACDPKDPASIASALDWFLKHPEETRNMGERGRVRVVEEWNYSRQFKSVQEVLLGPKKTQR